LLIWAIGIQRKGAHRRVDNHIDFHWKII